MHIYINDMEIELRKTTYHKSYIAENGITHNIDISNTYTAYQLGMAKNYYDVENTMQTLDEIISDLRTIADEFERLKEKEAEKIPQDNAR